MEISDRIKKLRADAQLSQQEFAEKLGCSKSQVAQWEIGNNYPKLENLITMARTFHVTTDWILTGEASRATRKPSTSEAPSVKKEGYYTDKLTELLARQQEKDEILVKTANAAIQVAEAVTVNLGEIQKTISGNHRVVQGLQLYLVKRFAAADKVAPEQIAEAIDNEVMEFGKPQNKRSKGVQGKQHRAFN